MTSLAHAHPKRCEPQSSLPPSFHSHQLAHALADRVANLSHPYERLPLRIRKRPIVTLNARHYGATFATPPIVTSSKDRLAKHRVCCRDARKCSNDLRQHDAVGEPFQPGSTSLGGERTLMSRFDIAIA